MPNQDEIRKAIEQIKEIRDSWIVDEEVRSDEKRSACSVLIGLAQSVIDKEDKNYVDNSK